MNKTLNEGEIKMNDNYNNYLMNAKTLLNAECVENESNGFLGTDITYCGKTFKCSVVGCSVVMEYGGYMNRGIRKSLFTIAKKDATNQKHAEAIKERMRRLVAANGDYAGAAEIV